VLLKAIALHNLGMDVNRALPTLGDWAQLFSEARALSSDDITNGRLAQGV